MKPTLLTLFLFFACHQMNAQNQTQTTSIPNSIRVFPNPTSSQVFVEVDPSITDTVTVVYLNNIIGATIAKESLKEGKAKFNVSELPEGVYFVRVGDYFTFRLSVGDGR